MSVNDITEESVLAAVRSARWAPSTVELAHHFGVIPTSHTLHQAIERLVKAARLVVANPGCVPVTWAAA